jgi:hypothetical protein
MQGYFLEVVFSDDAHCFRAGVNGFAHGLFEPGGFDGGAVRDGEVLTRV